MTGEKLLEKRPVVYDALAIGDKWLGALVHPYGPLRWKLPTPEGFRGRRLRRELDDAINALLAERRRDGGGSDLLASWVKSGAETGATDADIRGSLKAYFGAENLHTHIAWTFHLLAQNPEAEAKLHEELDRVLAGRPPTPDDLGQLRYTRNVIMESLRIYPSVPAFFRGIEGGDLKLGDQSVAKGTLLAFSPWTMHRKPELWPDPLRFDPDRWNPGQSRPHRYAYFPFAGGPYQCPGTAKSVREGPLVLATLAQRWRMRPPPGVPAPIPTAKWALVAKHGIPMITERRG
jgi:cytochrome P450